MADQYLVPELENVERFDFDFTKRSKVTAAAILKGEAYAAWDDHVLKDGKKVEKTEAKGETAEADQKKMEAYAKELKDRLAGRIPRRVEANNPWTLLSMAHAAGAHYLFVINDKRTYSERLKPYQSQLDQIVPQTPRISLVDPELARGAAYDLIQNKRIVITPGDVSSIEVPLDRLGGTLVAFYPQAISKLNVTLPSTIAPGEPVPLKIQILGEDGKLLTGFQPVQITVTSPDGQIHEDSGFTTLQGGTGTFTFHATNDRGEGKWLVTTRDLSAGLIAYHELLVQK